MTRILLICSTCQGKLVIFFIYTTKENLSRKTCQGKLASVYSRQVFLDKWTCQGKIAGVNGALRFQRANAAYCMCKTRVHNSPLLYMIQPRTHALHSQTIESLTSIFLLDPAWSWRTILNRKIPVTITRCLFKSRLKTWVT